MYVEWNLKENDKEQVYEIHIKISPQGDNEGIFLLFEKKNILTNLLSYPVFDVAKVEYVVVDEQEKTVYYIKDLFNRLKPVRKHFYVVEANRLIILKFDNKKTWRKVNLGLEKPLAKLYFLIDK